MPQPYGSEYVEDIPFEAFVEESDSYVIDEQQPYGDLTYEEYNAEYYQDYSSEFFDEAQVTYQYEYSGPNFQAPAGNFLPFLMVAPLAVLVMSVILIVSLGIIKIGPLPAPQIAAPAPAPAENQEPGSVDAPQSQFTGSLSPLFTPSVQFWNDQILAWSEKWNMDPNMVATVMQIESCGDPGATSIAGAMGLFQVMPFHFENGEDGYDPQTNAKRGLAYLRQSLKTHGGLARLAFAGYNGGIGGSQRPESQWHQETQRYVYWATGIYEDATAGKDQSSFLQEWLSRGGAGLCERASSSLGVAP